MAYVVMAHKVLACTGMAANLIWVHENGLALALVEPPSLDAILVRKFLKINLRVPGRHGRVECSSECSIERPFECPIECSIGCSIECSTSSYIWPSLPEIGSMAQIFIFCQASPTKGGHNYIGHNYILRDRIDGADLHILQATKPWRAFYIAARGHGGLSTLLREDTDDSVDVHPSAHRCIDPAVRRSIGSPIDRFIHLAIRPSIPPSTYPRPSARPSTGLPNYPSVRPSIHPTARP